MKIALITDSFTTGGGLEHIYQLCLGMPDVEFGVFGKKGNAKSKFEKLSNVTVFTNGYDKKEIIDFKPNVVHIHHLKPLLFLYNIEIKTIVTIHGIHLHKYEFTKGIKSKILKFLRLNLEKYLYKKVNKIITVSDDDKEYLNKYHKIDSKVIYNGIDSKPIEEITQSKEELRKELLLPQDIRIYLTVARFDFPKGYDILIEAIKVSKDNNEIKNKLFVFVGDGDLIDEMKLLVTTHNLNDYVLFMGRRTDIYKIMKASDCFILPSRWEGLPITLLEALACNLPIIASDTYGNRTVKRVENRIKLFKNLNSIDLSKKFSDYEKVSFKNAFSLENMVDKTRLEYGFIK